MNWKKAVPRYRPDGSIYVVDNPNRGRTPTGLMPPDMTGSAAMSEDVPTSMAPTPQEFTVSTPAQAEETAMDWEAVDSRLNQVQVDTQLREEVEHDDNMKADDQPSREALQIAVARTPSSLVTVGLFRSPAGGSSIRSRSAPAKKRRSERDKDQEEDSQELYADEIKDMLEEQERNLHAGGSDRGQSEGTGVSSGHSSTKNGNITSRRERPSGAPEGCGQSNDTRSSGGLKGKDDEGSEWDIKALE